MNRLASKYPKWTVLILPIAGLFSAPPRAILRAFASVCFGANPSRSSCNMTGYIRMTRPAFAAKVYDSLSGRGGHFKAGNGTDKQAAFVTPCISLGVRYFKPRWKKTPVYTHVIEKHACVADRDVITTLRPVFSIIKQFCLKKAWMKREGLCSSLQRIRSRGPRNLQDKEDDGLLTATSKSVSWSRPIYIYAHLTCYEREKKRFPSQFLTTCRRQVFKLLGACVILSPSCCYSLPNTQSSCFIHIIPARTA